MAGRKLTCQPLGYPGGAGYSYFWLRSGSLIAGENSKTYKVRNSDVGARISCRIEVTNQVGSEQKTSPKTADVAPADLSRIPGSLVARPVCRELQAPGRVGSADLSYGHPVTPVSPLLIRARGLLSATLDGRPLGSGRSVLKVNPRTLNGLANGDHELVVQTRADSKTAGVVLGTCSQAARVIVGRSASMHVSSSVGMNPVTLQTARKMSFLPDRVVGRVYVKVLRQPQETFLLSGARTSSNGIHVAFSHHRVHVSGLPRNTGVIRISLGNGSFVGRGGRVVSRAHLKGSRGIQTAGARILIRR